MKRFGADLSPRRMHYCPECKKQRLSLPAGKTPSKEKREFDLPGGGKVELFEEVCQFCVRKYYERHFKPKRGDAQKIMRALQDEHKLPEDASLEELL